MRSLSAMSLTRPTDTRTTDPAESESWASAICAQTPITGEWDPWFPEPGNSGSYTEAAVLCGACPLARMCLEVALKEEAGLIRQQRFGMRGGLTPGQRYRLDGTSQRPARVGPACRDKRGTEAGHKRHLRANQTPCRECVAGAARERSDRSRDRDAKILELADQGMTQVEIARQLKIARATVNRLIGRSKAAS